MSNVGASPFSDFLFGFYNLIRFGSRVYREIERPREEKDTGYLDTIREVIDDSVFRKVRDDESYKIRKNLAEWAARKGISLERWR